LQVAARSTDQAGKIEYFKIPANAQNQDTSDFFTDDFKSLVVDLSQFLPSAARRTNDELVQV
jgi:hypothetical protein